MRHGCDLAHSSPRWHGVLVLRAQDDPIPSARLAGAVAPGRGSFVDALVRLTQTEIGELNHDDELTRLLRSSIEENVARLLAILGEGADPREEPPFGAREYARRLGSSPASLASLLRAYRIGQSQFTAHCLQVAATLEPPLPAAAQIEVVNQISHYLDHVCEHVTIVYQAEHERWLRGQEGLRLQWVRRLLDATESIDERRAAHELGYPLGGQHIAVELWAGGRGQDGPLESAAKAVAESFGGGGGWFSVRQDDRSLWLWLHPRADASSVVAPPLPDGVRAAAGAPGIGLDGFRRTRRQASRVRALMLSSRHAPQHTSWDEVAPIAALASDPAELRAFVENTLGLLSGADPRLEELRETLRVFLEHHQSHTKTAQVLHLHRNTVNYRVQQAIELLDGRLDGRSFALLTALHADRWCPAPAPRPSDTLSARTRTTRSARTTGV